MTAEVNTIDAVIGFFVPPVVSWLSKQSWPGAYKSLAAFGFAVLIGIIRVALNGQFSLEDWGGTIFLVLGVAQISYITFWKPTGAADKLEQVGPVKDEPLSSALQNELEKG